MQCIIYPRRWISISSPDNKERGYTKTTITAVAASTAATDWRRGAHDKSPPCSLQQTRPTKTVREQHRRPPLPVMLKMNETAMGLSIYHWLYPGGDGTFFYRLLYRAIEKRDDHSSGNNGTLWHTRPTPAHAAMAPLDVQQAGDLHALAGRAYHE